MLGIGRIALLLAVSACFVGCEQAYREEFGAFPTFTSDLTDSTCASGLRLKLTGLCADDHPALFVATTPDTDFFGPGDVDEPGPAKPAPAELPSNCMWRAAEVELPDDSALVFRTLNCRPRGQLINGRFVAENGYRVATKDMHYYEGCGVSFSADAGLAFVDICAGEVLPIASGETAESTVLGSMAGRASKLGRQATNCSAHARTDLGATGHAFEIRCDAWVYGWWEARPGLVVHRVDPSSHFGIDANSYTHYVRNSSGSWRKTT